MEDSAEEEGGGGQKAPGGLKGIRLNLLVPGWGTVYKGYKKVILP
jgi:hypothetical protein